MMSLFYSLCILGMFVSKTSANSEYDGRSCYNREGKAILCRPEFVNAAFGLIPESSNTCGVSKRTEYCLQTGVTGAIIACHTCDATVPGLSHPPSYLTDFNNQHNWTWWQSDTMHSFGDSEAIVNITLNLKKTFDITYIRLRFHSSRPESFAIYKKTGEDGEWIPFQYYSSSCEQTFGLPRDATIPRDDETKAICSSEYSDISPLTGGSVAFSTLMGRPGALNFENNPVLQKFVTASHIRIVLRRMNTFGDEVFGDEKVLKTYFYALTDLAVGGRCRCNGHGNECVTKTNQNLEETLVCRCQHNTMGPNCQECLPFYNDRPWGRATRRDGYQCMPCDCNGLSETCYFDQELFDQTGHGGHCTNCRDNAGGAHCEICLENHYRRSDNRCIPCNCNEIGSENLQCGDDGLCRCKPGVTGDRCDRCETNYFDFGPEGCSPCGCTEAGSFDNKPVCDPRTGLCTCKENVEGRNCDQCKAGFFGLDENNPLGCLQCFCYGHSIMCEVAEGYFGRSISSDVQTGAQSWTAKDRRGDEVSVNYNGILGNIGVSSSDHTYLYFVAPSRYTGDLRGSYNQLMKFKLRIGEDIASASVIDVVLEGSGKMIHAPISAQGNSLPKITNQEFTYRLHEHRDYQWSPQLSSQDFIGILSNLTAVKIRAVYGKQGVGYLDDFQIQTASRGYDGGDEARWIEKCQCPEGYIDGGFCDECEAGYKRDPPNGGVYARCVPCQCNGHSDICDVDTGRCICEHNTVGDFCDRCEIGFYGDPATGTPEDCQPCPCPDGGACRQLRNGDVVCLECPEGYGGDQCEFCLDGYSGDPRGVYGPARRCEKCTCNDNIDPNSVHNCNTTTGECLKCIHNTAGFHCEECLPNYYGDALALPKGQCKVCGCDPRGTILAGLFACNPITGQCPCLPNVQGRQCDRCESGFWNIDSRDGCDPCYCNEYGSTNGTCDTYSGQCQCKQGVVGRQCDTCQRYFYGFSPSGCQACNCEPEGSLDLQCDENGYCPCHTNIEGRRCDRCMENKFNISVGCVDCPRCYDLVQDRVNTHRHKLRDLRNLINNIGSNPSVFNDTEFIEKMNGVNDSVIMLLNEARGATSDQGVLNEQLHQLREAIHDLTGKTEKISDNINSADESALQSSYDVVIAEESIKRAEKALGDAKQYIDTQGQAALQRAHEALDRFGQQSEQMTLNVQRATRLANEQLQQANHIRDVAQNALNTSREALRLAQKALRMPDMTEREIDELRRNYDDAERLFEQTRVLGERAKDRASKAYQDALELYTAASSIQVPSVDVPAFIKDAMEIKNEAANLKARAEELLQQNDELLNDVQMQRNISENLLENGIKHQQVADRLLAEVDNARSLAIEAVESGERTLQDANDTLYTLLEFDSLVQDSRGKAANSLQKVPEIEDLIQKAENKTKEAREALSGAESDAKEALQLAQKAQTTAQNASSEASRIRSEAESTKHLSVDYHEEADRLKLDLQTVENRIKELEDESDSDMKLSQEAQNKAASAKQAAVQTSDKVTEALSTVNDIISLLGNIDVIDPSLLDKLEKDLNLLEVDITNANLEKEFNRLNQQNEKVKTWVRQYSEDITQLRLDVDNIEEIKKALPTGCFKNIEIESPRT